MAVIPNRLRLKLIGLSVLNLTSAGAWGQRSKSEGAFTPIGNPTMKGFLSGNDFRHYSQPEKLAYVTGIYDGYMFAPAFGANSVNDQILHDCIPNIMSDQLLAIVEKYMKEHPEEWGSPMNGIVFSSLPRSCRDAT